MYYATEIVDNYIYMIFWKESCLSNHFVVSPIRD